MLNYTLKRAKVMDGGEEIATVRGLSLNDIMQLVTLNMSAMQMLFDQFKDRATEEISADEIAATGMELLRSAPGLIAQIIAIGTDAYADYEPSEGTASPLEVIKSMPTGTQIACIEEIGKLTFTADFGPKKVIALVLKAVQGTIRGGSDTRALKD